MATPKGRRARALARGATLASLGRMIVLACVLVALAIWSVSLAYQGEASPMADRQPPTPLAYHGGGCAYLHDATGMAHGVLHGAWGLLAPWL